MSDRCIICNGKNLKRYKASICSFLTERMFSNKQNETDFLRCKDCSIGYFELRPDEKQMSDLYNDYRGNDYQKQRQLHEQGYTPEFNNKLGHALDENKKRKEHLANILKKNVDISEIKTVLDYGGDEGQFIPENLETAEKFVYEVSGIEPINGIKPISNEEELKKYQWDFIMCCHVLEHVSYPMEILNKILSILKPGGYLYIELPNEPIKNYSLGSFIRRPRNFFKAISNKSLINLPQMHEHINFFSIKTLEHIFSNLGYEILDKEEGPIIINILVKRGGSN